MYVVRISYEMSHQVHSRNQPRSVGPALKTSYSKPCSYCVSFLKRLGVKKVYYTTGDIFTDPTAWTCENVRDLECDHVSSGNRRFII
jgi:hypothetical protein